MPTHSTSRSFRTQNTIRTTVTVTKALISSNTTSTSVNWTDSVIHGANVPGWREVIRSGGDATTSLSGSECTARLTPGYAKSVDYGGWTDESTGDHRTSEAGLPGDPSSLDAAKANAEALGKLNQRIRQVRTLFEGGVVLGELGQTLRMIRNPARGLRNLTDEFLDIARAIRRGASRQYLSNALRASKVAEHLADAWLEVQFGWRPLLSDIRDGCEALEAYDAGGRLETIRVTGKSQVAVTSATTTNTWVVGPMGFARDTVTDGHTSVIYRGAVRVKARDPQTMDPALFGFDPSSFLPTAWELIPYSFLIDYFSNIGDIVTGWSNVFSDLAWCNSTTRKWYTLEGTSRKTNGAFLTFTPAKYVSTRKSVQRQKYEGTLVPDFTLQVPGMGSLKWLNIAALIASRNADRRWSFD